MRSERDIQRAFQRVMVLCSTILGIALALLLPLFASLGRPELDIPSPVAIGGSLVLLVFASALLAIIGGGLAAITSAASSWLMRRARERGYSRRLGLFVFGVSLLLISTTLLGILVLTSSGSFSLSLILVLTAFNSLVDLLAVVLVRRSSTRNAVSSRK